MSLARALTTIGRRGRKTDGDSTLPQMTIGRAASQRAGRPILRAQISSPLALVSTSNMQVHEAPSIAGTAPIDMHHLAEATSDASSEADDDSDASSLVFSPGGSDMTVTDASSIDEAASPSSSVGPKPNHLSCYFQPTVDTSGRSRASTLNSTASTDLGSPSIPSRVPSHSKKAHERVHRTRSLQRIRTPGPAAQRLQEIVAQPEFVESPERASPFGSELAQLDEVAEEFGQVAARADADAEAVYMREKGLVCFAAADYMSEIDDLVRVTFGLAEVAGSAWL